MNKKTNQLKINEIIDSLKISNVKELDIIDELKQSFLDYAMSVITARALPDVRDGLKPIHRRILYTAFENKLTSDKKFSKSAKLVGQIMGSYHPHGDSSIYEALVRLAQDFSLRYPLIEGQGNFGSIDGDAAAAMRYTESRLSKMADLFLDGINDDTVDFVANYDETLKEPSVLPTAIPNILINGIKGIAVGMATTIPPHNLKEVCDGILALLENPQLSVEQLQEYILGPDFPTGGEIHNIDGIQNYFLSGKGSFFNRAKVIIDDDEQNRLIVQEIPYNLNKKNLIDRIIKVAKPGKNDTIIKEIAGNITDIRDESNREGIRLIIELKKDVNPHIILNALYHHTPLQLNFSANITVLVDKSPKVLGILDVLKYYLKHQFAVLVRRTKHNLIKINERIHILDGRQIVVDNIKYILDIIQNEDDVENILIKKYNFSEIQLKDVLSLPLRSLKKIERTKLATELKELNENKINQQNILNSKEKQVEIIKNKTIEIKNKFGDNRKTVIYNNSLGKIDYETLIPNILVVITLSEKGYIKRTSIDEFKTHKRGGVGARAASIYDDDNIKMLLTCMAHDELFFFSSKGKVYRSKAFNITETKKTGRGKTAKSIFESLDTNEFICTMLVYKKELTAEKKSLLFVTKNGYIKKTELIHYVRINANGKNAVKIDQDDQLMYVLCVSEDDEILLASSLNRMVRFMCNKIKNTGRNARGVRGIKISKNDSLISASSSNEGKYVLSISSKGIGKLSKITDFRLTSRNSKGVIAQKINEKTGQLVMCLVVNGKEDIFIMTDKGITNRFNISSLNVLKRNTSGVKLFNIMKLENQKIVYVAKHQKIDDENDNLEINFELVKQETN